MYNNVSQHHHHHHHLRNLQHQQPHRLDQCKSKINIYYWLCRMGLVSLRCSNGRHRSSSSGRARRAGRGPRRTFRSSAVWKTAWSASFSASSPSPSLDTCSPMIPSTSQLTYPSANDNSTIVYKHYSAIRHCRENCHGIFSYGHLLRYL